MEFSNIVKHNINDMFMTVIFIKFVLMWQFKLHLFTLKLYILDRLQ